MDNHLNGQQAFLRTYRVNYISGLPQMPELVPNVFMNLSENGFFFCGKRFSDLWIAYDSVVEFKLSTGYGSKWNYVPQDALNKKIININYYTDNHEIRLIKFEMAISVFSSPAKNYNACKELVNFMQQNGIFNKFVTTAVTNNTSSDIVAQIEKLAELHKSGALTDEEFQRAKSELLKKL